VSAQKTAVVCLIVFVALVTNSLVSLIASTRTAVLVGRHSVSVDVCIGAKEGDSCALLVSVQRSR